MGQKIKLFERKRSKALINRCGVYAIYVDNHTYVGSSENLSRRMTEHRLDIPKERRGCRLLHEFYKYYTKDDFYYEILEYCSPKDRLLREKYYINVLDADCNTAKDPKHPIVHSRKIYQYDINGNYVAEYNSVTDAARKVNGTEGNISNATNNYKYSYNSLWSFTKHNHYPHVPNTKPKTKKVCVFKTRNSKPFKQFLSISDAARFVISYTNSSKSFDGVCALISNRCSGKTKKDYKGLYFQFNNQ